MEFEKFITATVAPPPRDSNRGVESNSTDVYVHVRGHVYAYGVQKLLTLHDLSYHDCFIYLC